MFLVILVSSAVRNEAAFRWLFVAGQRHVEGHRGHRHANVRSGYGRGEAVVKQDGVMFLSK